MQFRYCIGRGGEDVLPPARIMIRSCPTGRRDLCVLFNSTLPSIIVVMWPLASETIPIRTWTISHYVPRFISSQLAPTPKSFLRQDKDGPNSLSVCGVGGINVKKARREGRERRASFCPAAAAAQTNLRKMRRFGSHDCLLLIAAVVVKRWL